MKNTIEMTAKQSEDFFSSLMELSGIQSSDQYKKEQEIKSLNSFNQKYGRKYTKIPVNRCGKCDGQGTLIAYTHVSAGKCFSCNGSGKKA